MDIQIKFAEPQELTRVISEPDYLKLSFVDSKLFLDKEGLTWLEEELELDFSILPQMTQAQIQEVEALEDKA